MNLLKKPDLGGMAGLLTPEPLMDGVPSRLRVGVTLELLLLPPPSGSGGGVATVLPLPGVGARECGDTPPWLVPLSADVFSPEAAASALSFFLWKREPKKPLALPLCWLPLSLLPWSPAAS